MFISLVQLASYHKELMGECPWWVTVICIILHLWALFKCVLMDNSDLNSFEKRSHNTVHTLFWLLVILMLPFVGILLFHMFSVCTYHSWAELKTEKDDFPVSIKLFQGNCSDRLWKLWGKRDFELTLFTNNFQSKGVIPIRSVNAPLILGILFAICVIIAISRTIDDMCHYVDEFDTATFQIAFIMVVLIVVYDWMINYNKANLYFRVVKDDSDPWEEAEPIFGKNHKVEHDYCFIEDNDRKYDYKTIPPKALKKTIDKLMPELSSPYYLCSIAEKCATRKDGFPIEGYENSHIQILDPTFNIDLLDVKEVTQLKTVDSHITRYVYFDWYVGAGYQENDDDPDKSCIERTVYRVKPKFRYLVMRTLVYIAMIFMLFTPIYYMLNTMCLSVLDPILRYFLF